MFDEIRSWLSPHFTTSSNRNDVGHFSEITKVPKIEIISPEPQPVLEDKAALKMFQMLGKTPELLDNRNYNEWLAELELDEILALVRDDLIPEAFESIVDDLLGIEEIKELYETGVNRLTFAYTYSEYSVDPNGHAHSISVGTEITAPSSERYVLQLSKRKNLTNPHRASDFNNGLWIHKIIDSVAGSTLMGPKDEQFYDIAPNFADFIFNQYNPGVVTPDGPKPRYMPGGAW